MTPASWRLIAAVESLRDQLRSMDMDEENTFTRLAVRSRIEAYDNAIRLLREQLPDVEYEAREGIGDEIAA